MFLDKVLDQTERSDQKIRKDQFVVNYSCSFSGHRRGGGGGGGGGGGVVRIFVGT